MDTKKLKFAYLRDPGDERRVLTLCWHDGMSLMGDVHYAYTINKIVEKKDLRLDDRLRPFLGNAIFKDLQKKFTKRFGGDQHCKKQARAVVKGKFMKGPYRVKYDSEKNIILLILNDIYDRINESLFDGNGNYTTYKIIQNVRNSVIHRLRLS